MKKKKRNWFLRILTMLFLVFIALFIISETGYYEAKVNRSVALTSDAIKQFEEDIINGKEVDIITYIDNDEKDYSNFFTKAGDKISSATEKLLTEGFTGIWDIIKILFL